MEETPCYRKDNMNIISTSEIRYTEANKKKFTIDPVVYIIWRPPTGLLKITVPVGCEFETTILNGTRFDDLPIKAVLFHDYLYECKGMIGNYKFTRREVDDAFISMLSPGLKRIMIKYILRIGGWIYWNI